MWLITNCAAACEQILTRRVSLCTAFNVLERQVPGQDERETIGGPSLASICNGSYLLGLMTTIVLVAGMLTAGFGDDRDARFFGIMGAIRWTSAWLADSFFLAAFLRRYAKRVRAA